MNPSLKIGGKKKHQSHAEQQLKKLQPTKLRKLLLVPITGGKKKLPLKRAKLLLKKLPLLKAKEPAALKWWEEEVPAKVRKAVAEAPVKTRKALAKGAKALKAKKSAFHS